LRTIVTVALLAAAFSAYGHGGEDHSEPPAVVTQILAPRATAATDEFEIVTVVDGKKLIVYVDRFGSNELVTKAKLEVEGAGLKGVASESSSGVYMLDLAAPLAPGKHALTISIETAETADLIATTLDIAAPTAAVVVETSWTAPYGYGALGLLVLGGAILVARRKKQ
jgi:hypothetical protein